MKVLIEPEIIIRKPVKNKLYGFKIYLCKKSNNELTIKAYSHCGKSRGVTGKVLKTGEIIKIENGKIVTPALTDKLRMKVDILLYLMYGKTRDKEVQFHKGKVVFNKN